MHRWIISLALVAALAAAPPAAADISDLNLSVSVNQAAYAVGDTIRYSLTFQNPGIPNELADLYLGVIYPDLSIRFFTGFGFAHGTLDFGSFVPIVTSMSLTLPFSLAAPNFLSEVVNASDIEGTYIFFLLALRAGTLNFVQDAGTHDGEPTTIPLSDWSLAHTNIVRQWTNPGGY